jgi:nicotinamide-nucleotide amidase
MSKEIRIMFNADVGISTTGISGPSGGSNDKPVGRIYIAISTKNNEIVKEFDLIPTRKHHREVAVHVALNMLRLLFKKIN